MTKEGTATNGREIVLDILLEVEKGALSHLVLNQALSKYGYLEKQERAFITRLLEGTLEYEIRLDAVIDSFSKVKVKKMKPVIRNILRMSAYQILYMERVPDSAVCNEAVKLARKRKFDGLSGFVNGVLRTVSREKERISFKESWVEYSIPKWIFDRWEKEYGQETAKKMAASFLEDGGLTVRFNESRNPLEDTKESLKRQGIAVTESPIHESLAAISGYDTLEQVEAFQKGFLTVQDPASALVALIADPKETDFVLDVCSAPGGKALHAADLMGGKGLVTARDLTDYKVSLIEENIFRCGFSNIRAEVFDATEFDPSMEGKADILLADLPCSGLGIMGKKPDIKKRLKEEDLESLARLQRQILSVVSRYVKPGGTLIYSTCTINPGENEENAAWILKNLPFEKKEIRERLPEIFQASCKENQIQILPGVHPADGFFIAAFTRK